MQSTTPAVWFPTIRAHTGADIFTENLASELQRIGIRTEITWLPLHSEYAPWAVSVPSAPKWATVAHVNTCMHSRFLPSHIPVVATLHHAVHAPTERSYKSALQAIYHRHWIAPNECKILRRADRAIAVSNHVSATCRNTLVDVPMQTIYNGVDVEIFKPKQRGERTKRPFRLLYIGSWIKRKGVDLLPHIMRQLGDGFELSYTGDSSKNHGKQDYPANMRDIGRLPGATQVAAALHNSDALLFPSRSEGFGLVAAEASACGVPVIASRAASLPEVINDGTTGILCTPDDILAFAAAARSLAENPLLYESMSQAAIENIRAKFTSKKMLHEYEHIYRLLTKNRNSHER